MGNGWELRAGLPQHTWLSAAKPSRRAAPLNRHPSLQWELSGGIQDSKFASFGRALLPWLRVSIHEPMMRNPSLNLESVAESPATALGIQQKSLPSRARVALDNRIALTVAEQRGVCAVARPPIVPGSTLLKKLKLSCIRSRSNPLGLKW